MDRTLNAFNQTITEPGGLADDFQRTSFTRTPYMVKLLEANEAPAWDNIRAALFSWLTLAGYVVFPGTFTSLKSSQTLASSDSGRVIQHAIKNIPLLLVAMLCCLVGTMGTGWLWWTWRNNAVWLIGHIFLPGLLHSFVGLITTLIIVYTAQNGHWSVTAKISIIVIGICTGNTSALYLIYHYGVLERTKTPSDRALANQSRM